MKSVSGGCWGEGGRGALCSKPLFPIGKARGAWVRALLANPVAYDTQRTLG